MIFGKADVFVHVEGDNMLEPLDTTCETEDQTQQQKTSRDFPCLHKPDERFISRDRR
jgi:hypothetical protein